MSKIKRELLLGNYWEHFKLAKDLALIYDINSPIRRRLDDSMNAIRAELDKEEKNVD